METPNEFCYLSAATSPTSICSLEDSLLNFYSAPTSPTSEASNTLFGFKTEPTTPTRSYDHGYFNHSFLGSNDFEFDTSRDFELRSDEDEFKRNRNRNRTMSFADELFHDGKVVPLAPPVPELKLPPGFCGGRSGAAAEPRPPLSAVLGLSPPRQCLWNDDFDPFVEALETVKEEKEKGGNQMEGNNCRRVRPSEYYLGLLRSPRAVGEEVVGSNGLEKPNKSAFSRWASKCEKSPSGDMGSERKGPKRVVSVRRMRVGRKRAGEVSPAQSPKVAKKSEACRGSKWSFYIREKKRQRILRILFRFPNSGKESGCCDEEKKERKHQNGAALWKPTFLRGLSFRSIGQTQNDKDKKVVSRVVKMTLVQYRPRLSLCMGFGRKYEQ